jgi:hypothetical protein
LLLGLRQKLYSETSRVLPEFQQAFPGMFGTGFNLMAQIPKGIGYGSFKVAAMIGCAATPCYGRT